MSKELVKGILLVFRQGNGYIMFLGLNLHYKKEIFMNQTKEIQDELSEAFEEKRKI